MKKPRKRILCVCSQGNIRSQALAYLLRSLYNYDVLACGVKGNSPYTVEYLCKWADRIIVLETEFKTMLLEKFHPKIVIYDVGKDLFHDAKNPELLHKLYKYLNKCMFTIKPIRRIMFLLSLIHI